MERQHPHGQDDTAHQSRLDATTLRPAQRPSGRRQARTHRSRRASKRRMQENRLSGAASTGRNCARHRSGCRLDSRKRGRRRQWSINSRTGCEQTLATGVSCWRIQSCHGPAHRSNKLYFRPQYLALLSRSHLRSVRERVSGNLQLAPVQYLCLICHQQQCLVHVFPGHRFEPDHLRFQQPIQHYL